MLDGRHMSALYPDPIAYARSLPPLDRPLPHGATAEAFVLSQRVADAVLRQAITEALAACGGDPVAAGVRLGFAPQVLARVAARLGIVTAKRKPGRKPRR